MPEGPLNIKRNATRADRLVRNGVLARTLFSMNFVNQLEEYSPENSFFPKERSSKTNDSDPELRI